MDPYVKKTIKATLGAGALAAGIGAVINRVKANKKREKDLNLGESKNAIVVNIDKSGFLKDIPTPDQLAESRGEAAKPQKGPSKDMAKGGVPARNVSVKRDMKGSVGIKDIAAIKKDILRRNGRKLDFFGKMASDNDSGDKYENKGSSPEEQSKGEISDKNVEGKESKETHILPRNDIGQFVSPTDPVGVIKAEKDAADRNSRSGGEFLSNAIFHPIDTLEGVAKGITSHKPLTFAVGSIASMYLASMIVDKINDIRAKKAKKDSDLARDAYANLLQNGSQEKSAGWEENIGLVGGASFVVPAVLTAVIANKVMERRKADKEKAKRVSDSIPDDPVILYKTSEAKNVEISAETALTLFMLKKAMIEEDALVKEAAVLPRAVGYGVKGLQRLGGAIEKNMPYADLLKYYNPNTNELSDEGWAVLGSGKYNGLLYDIADGYLNNNGSSEILSKMDKIKHDPRLLDIYAKLFSSGSDRAKKIQSQVMDRKMSDYLGRYFGDKGFGGRLKKIILWLANSTGISGWLFRRNLKNNLAGHLGTKFPVRQSVPTRTAFQVLSQSAPDKTEAPDVSAVPDKYTSPYAQQAPSADMGHSSGVAAQGSEKETAVADKPATPKSPRPMHH